MGSQSSQVAKVLKQSLAAWEENTDERREEKLSLREALARALLEQTDHFLDPQFKEHADKLERIQKSTARMIWSLEKLRECQELNIIYLEEA